MKTITFAVPCYNAQGHMQKCVDSLLSNAADDIEIIIINDGSVDDTAEIADNYTRDFAGVVKVIHQPNSGHGGAINAGLAAASGKYFKVVDSDDYVDKASYTEVLSALRNLTDQKTLVDLVICNYVYEKIGRKRHRVINYTAALPEKKAVGWEQTRPFAQGQYLLMHALIYRTDVLRESGIVLPQHSFYVDNYFAYMPLTFVKTLYYINTDFYRYVTGSQGQSVNESTMIKRIGQQIAVNKLMYESVDLQTVTNKKLLNYLIHYLEIVTSISMILLIRSNTKENLLLKGELWEYVKGFPVAYEALRRGWIMKILCLTGPVGRRISVIAYYWFRFSYGLN